MYYKSFYVFLGCCFFLFLFFFAHKPKLKHILAMNGNAGKVLSNKKINLMIKSAKERRK